MEAYADDPLRLGAFARLIEESRPYQPLFEEVRALKVAIEKAAAAGAGDDTAARAGAGGAAGSPGEEAATTTTPPPLSELRERLRTAEAALETARRRKSDLLRFARHIGKQLGFKARSTPRLEQRLADDQESVIRSLGKPKELEKLGRRVLAERATPKPPPGAEGLKPDVAWEVAADVLARDALEQERVAGETWLRPGGGLESVSFHSDERAHGCA